MSEDTGSARVVSSGVDVVLLMVFTIVQQRLSVDDVSTFSFLLLLLFLLFLRTFIYATLHYTTRYYSLLIAYG